MTWVLNRRSLLQCGAFAAALTFANVAWADEPALATQDEVVEAYDVLREWTEAYRAKDYDAQWLLIHPRIRRWHNKKRWNGWMKKAQKRNGDLLSYVAEYGTPIQADQIPCTEQGHCARRGIQYIMYIIRTEYETAEPGQPEYAIMAKSRAGWRFGGGSFLNRPMGETSIIMTEQDEARYKPKIYSQ